MYVPSMRGVYLNMPPTGILSYIHHNVDPDSVHILMWEYYRIQVHKLCVDKQICCAFFHVSIHMHAHIAFASLEHYRSKL